MKTNYLLRKKASFFKFLRYILNIKKREKMSETGSTIFLASVDSSLVDFSLIDLSPWGIKGGLIESAGTQKFIRSNSMETHDEQNWKRITENAQGFGDGAGKRVNWEYSNLLWPIDINKPPSKQDYFEAIEAIRVAHPSEVYISNIFMCQHFKAKGIYINAWTTYESYQSNKYENIEDHYFYQPEDRLEETNRFLAFFKENYNKQKYITSALKYYIESFQVNSPEMAFVCLCICLETIVPGKEQLSFKFRRNLAVLCSETLEEGQGVYKNANLLYSFRSKLVHSGMDKKNIKKFDEYFEYAQILASRMIIEMLSHDISGIESLDRRLTELGFGDKTKISENYNEFKVDIITWHRVSMYKLTKLK